MGQFIGFLGTDEDFLVILQYQLQADISPDVIGFPQSFPGVPDTPPAVFEDGGIGPDLPFFNLGERDVMKFCVKRKEPIINPIRFDFGDQAQRPEKNHESQTNDDDYRTDQE